MNIYYKKDEREALRDGLDFLFTDFARAYNDLDDTKEICLRIYKTFKKEYPSLKKSNKIFKMLCNLFSNFSSNEKTLISFWYLKEFEVKHPKKARDIIDLDVFCTHLKVLHFILGGKEILIINKSQKWIDYEECLLDYWIYLQSKMTYTV